MVAVSGFFIKSGILTRHFVFVAECLLWGQTLEDQKKATRNSTDKRVIGGGCAQAIRRCIKQQLPPTVVGCKSLFDPHLQPE